MFRKIVDYTINNDKYGSYNSDIEVLVPPNTKVLDLGCTTGKLARALKNKNCIVVGIDIDDRALKQASKYCLKTLKIDLDNLNSLDTQLRGDIFDCITCGDLLEHIKYPGVLLFHLKRYLKPRGLLIATIPNSAFIWMRLKFLFGNLSYSQDGGLMDEDHLRFFSFKTARLLFEESGYEVMKIKPSNTAIINPKYNFMKYLTNIIPSLFALHIVIIGRVTKKGL